MTLLEKIIRSKTLRAIVFVLLAFTFTILFDLFPISEKLELITLDTRYKIRHRAEQSDKIVLINIDDSSIELYGQWPWSRKYQVALIETLSAIDVGYIIYDVFFSEHEQPVIIKKNDNSFKIVDNDSELQKAINNAGNVYLAYPSRDPSKDMTRDIVYEKAKSIFDKSEMEKQEGIRHILSSLKKTEPYLKNYLYKSIDLDPPILNLLTKAKGHGFAQPGYSQDGIVRNFIFFKDYNGYMLNALTLPVISDLFDIQLDKTQIIPSQNIVFSGKNSPNIPISIDKNAQSLLNWVGSFDNSFIHISFKDIIYLNLYDKAKRYLKDTGGFTSQKKLQYITHRLLEHDLLPREDVYSIAKLVVDSSKDDSFDNKSIPLLKARIKGNYTEIPPHELKGKIIFIGLTGKNTIDLNPTPFEPSCPMVFYHANAVNMFITGQFLTYPHLYLKYYVSFAFALIVTLIGINSTLPKTTLVSAVLCITFLSFAYIMWATKGHWVEIIIPVTSIILAYLTCLVFQVLTVYRERSRIRNIFSAMVSPKVLTLMEKNPSAFALTGQRRFATTYFSKIEGIEPIMQSVNPEEIPQVLSYYLTPMSHIIMEFDGYIDKYEGVVIMADFGVPLEDKDNPIKCALSSLQQRFFINAFRHHIKDFYMLDAFVSIGINSGFVSAGNMGSERKFQYTVMGDPVNTAARLMASNSIYQSNYPIVSEETVRLIEDFVYARPLDKLLLKGKTVPTKLYDLIGWKKDGYLEFTKGKMSQDYLFSLWARIPSGCILSYRDFWHREYETNRLDISKGIREFFESNTNNANTLLCLEFISDVLLANTEAESITQPNNISNRISIKDLNDTLMTKIESIIHLKESKTTHNTEDLLRSEALSRRLNSLAKREGLLKDRLKTYLIDTGIALLSAEETKTLIKRYRNLYETSVSAFIKSIKIDEYHRAMALAGEPANKEIAQIFSKGLELYWQRKWDDAIVEFNKAKELDKDDKPSHLMIDRINEYKLNPPSDEWQGEFIQTKK